MMQYEEIYRNNLSELYGTPSQEIFGVKFVLDNALDRVIYNKVRNFDPIGTEHMFQWILSGGRDSKDIIGLKSNAESFPTIYQGWSSAYGPRIVSQLAHVTEELGHDPKSRRACIMVLDSKDTLIAYGKRKGETNIEYPCAVSATYFIRDNALHSYTVMRSNNFVTTINIDVFLFTRLQEVIANRMGYQLGSYGHFAVNAHILEKDRQFAKEILKEYDNS